MGRLEGSVDFRWFPTTSRWASMFIFKDLKIPHKGPGACIKNKNIKKPRGLFSAESGRTILNIELLIFLNYHDLILRIVCMYVCTYLAKSLVTRLSAVNKNKK